MRSTKGKASIAAVTIWMVRSFSGWNRSGSAKTIMVTLSEPKVSST